MQDAGADYLMLLPPFFLKPGAKDLENHMRRVGEAVSIPIMVQYAPELTGVAIDVAVLGNLRNELEHMIYYKIECRPPGNYISQLMEQSRGQTKVFVGNAGYQMIEGFDRGAVGVMPGCSMFDVYLKIYEHYFNGERKAAIKLHGRLLPMLNHIFQHVEMIIYYEKRILKRRGIIESDYCRKPTFTPDVHYDRLFDEYYEYISREFNPM
jgi:4-hydroxy-tetrahydrodipicolinate synthase